MRLGFVTGLRSEAVIVEAAAREAPEETRPLLFCAGVRSGRTEAGIRRLVADGAGALVSFGIAGGLVPGLSPGRLVLASAVQTAGGPSYGVDIAWRGRLLARLAGALEPALGELAGSDVVLRTAEEKSRLHGQTAALAVDMESHVLARVAQERGLPCLVVRTIADPAGAGVPASALVGIGPMGETRPFAVLKQAALTPWEWPALLRLGRSHHLALGTLRRLIGLAGVGLAFEEWDAP